MNRCFLGFFLSILSFQAHPAIHFQESFEDSITNFYTVETSRFIFDTSNGSRRLLLSAKEPGYIRFKTRFPAHPVLAFDLALVKWHVAPSGSIHEQRILEISQYDTGKTPYTKNLLLELAISSGPDNPFRPRFHSNTGATLSGPFFKAGLPMRLSLVWEKRAGPESRLQLFADNQPLGTLPVLTRTGDLGILTWGQMDPMDTAFGETLFALDNILSADNLEEATAPDHAPELTAIVEEKNQVRLRTPVAATDSLLFIEASRHPTMQPLLFHRDIAASYATDRIFDMPLPQGRYCFRGRMLKKSGFITPWSRIITLEITDTHPHLAGYAIRDAIIKREKTGEVVTAIEPGVPYILTVRTTTVRDGYALFYLHHETFTDGGPHNKGGWFDRRLNYIFNFSFSKPPWLYASQEDIKGRSLRVDGKKYFYLDDSDRFFRVDSQKNEIRVRFSLLPGALPGPWILSGYLERGDRKERSFLFEKAFRVLSASDISTRDRARSRRRLLSAMALIVLAAAAAVGIMVRRGKTGKTGPEQPLSLLNRLRKESVMLITPDHKHRAVVQKAQAFILDNLGRDISLSDVALHLNLTPTWTGSFFKEATGYTVVQFITRIKIDRACELLGEGAMNATDASMSVGYASPDHFRRTFKDLTGVNPSEYRRKHPTTPTGSAPHD